MANPEHLKILQQGLEAWNKWRQAWPYVNPDLSKLDLTGINLRDARMRETNFSGVVLVRANLVQCDLTMANLGEADLRTALLGGARLNSARLRKTALGHTKLYGTDLGTADLTGADFEAAHFQGVNLNGANLNEMNLTGAIVESTLFANVDLSTVRGLEKILHRGPSTIGIDTIYRSRGKIPEVFLRGAGVPEDFIIYMRSLVGKPIEFYSCFISHSTEDQEFAERLHVDLQASGVRCWYAPEDLKIGDRFQERIEESIRVYDKLIVALSANAVDSRWIEREVQAAFEKEQRPPERTVLFPIRLDDAVMETPTAWAADVRRTRHIGDFRNWKNHASYQKAFERLLRDLRTEPS